jgi:hypothetical protein
MTPYFDPAGLRAGDVLLMKGISQVSNLIAWFGDSIYSHAAIMVGGGEFVEAALPQSRLVKLADRLKQVDHYDFITAYRPTQRSGEALDPAQHRALDTASRAQLGVNYPLNALVQMAVFAGLRNRVPADAKLRWLLREVLDYVLKFDPKNMVCSELVFKAMRDAQLAPALIVSAQLDLPLPKIDIVALIKEWLGARGETTDARAALGLEAVEEADEASLQQRFEALRAARSGDAPRAAMAAELNLGMPPVLNPNPRNVLPVDLETSPQLRLLGRLPLGA